MEPPVPLSAGQEAFRAEVAGVLGSPRAAAALAALAPSAPRAGVDARPVYRLLGERGLLAPAWPEELGGRAATAVETAIVHAELVRHGVPDVQWAISVAYAGTFLALAWEGAQRDSLLPPVARGERALAILYTEPDAGSDLRAIATRADPDGDGYAVHGRKVHSQTSQFAAHALVAVRTGAQPGSPDGITVLVVPLDAPGVSIALSPALPDEPFGDVVFDGVRVPAGAVVGLPGAGWRLLNGALALERTGWEQHLAVRHWLELTTAAWRASATPRGSDVAGRVAAARAAVSAGGLLAWDVVRAQAAGRFDDARGAAAKWLNGELGPDVVALAREVVGDEGSEPGHWLERAVREAPGLRLAGGSSEVMLLAIGASCVAGAGSAGHEPEAGASALDVAALEESGRRGADGALLDALAGADLLAGAAPGARQTELATALRAGSCRATVATRWGGDGAPSLRPHPRPQLSGMARFRWPDAAAPLLLVPLRAPQGVICVVNADAAGVAVAPPAGSGAGHVRVVFDDVAPEDVLVHADLEAALARARVRHAAFLVGLARGAWEAAAAHARRRHQFGRPLAAFQAPSFALAMLWARLEAGRTLVRRTAERAAAAEDTGGDAAAVLAHVAKLADAAATAGLHVHGAAGLLDTSPAQAFYRRVMRESGALGSPWELRRESGLRLRG